MTMTNENEHPEQDPAEGSREVIERDLAHQGGNRARAEDRDSDPTLSETETVGKSENGADDLIINPAADGTRRVEEPANDWPADDRPR